MQLISSAEDKFHYAPEEQNMYNTETKVKTNLIRDKVAFANNTGLGYNGNVVSGYELFVLDGCSRSAVECP